MRIIRFQAENIKKLKAVDITPDKNGVKLSGANEQGKTSVLDAIEMTLDGKALKRTKEPIRRGADKGWTLLSLGEPEYDLTGKELECKPDLKIKRTFTANDRTYLKVENAEGAEYKSPQAILDKIIGNLAFDPLSFSNLKEKDQLDTLLGLVSIPIDLNQWAIDRKLAYDERTTVNRQIAELLAQIKAIDFPDDTPDEEVSAASVLAEQREAQAVIDDNEARRRSLKQLSSHVGALESQAQVIANDIERLERDLANAKEQLNATNAELTERNREYDALAKQVDSLVDPDLSVFETRITEVESVNRYVRSKKQRSVMQAQFEEKRKCAETLTMEIVARDQERAEALKSAKMPIEDLSFDDNGVLYKGIPFAQCSSAERLAVSVAMGMALNPKLRVMFVRDGSLLDSKHRDLIAQMAEDNEYQVWMEVTDESGKVGLYIEDGEIVTK